MATPRLVPPQLLELDGDRLIYCHMLKAPFELEGRSPSRDLLRGFATLSNAEPEAILAFAKKWGVLGLCCHDMCVFHSPDRGCLPREYELPPGVPPPRARTREHPGYALTGLFWEPLSIWRTLAATFKLILATASATREGRLVENAITTSGGAALSKMGIEAGMARQRLALGMELNLQMRTFGVAPALTVTKSGADFWFGYDGLAGAVAMTTFAAVAGSSFGLCGGCGQVYEPTKRPREGEQQWCSKCRTRGHSRAAAARAYRHRKQQAIELHEQGKSLTHIAKAIERPASTVKQWLKGL